MKTIYRLLTILLITASGCSVDLDLAPLGVQTSATYYKTQADAEAAVIGAYNALRVVYAGNNGEHIVTPNVIAGDDGIPFLTGGADRVALWRFDIVPTNSFVVNVWSISYAAIQKSNIIIDKIPAIEMSESLKNQYIGEARFLRALHYFNLVRFYGEIPIVDKEITSLNGVEVSRNSLDEVYSFIEADLKEAESLLPATYPAAQLGRATRAAARALLAKVYLTRAGNTEGSPFWAQAVSKAKEVMDDPAYDLWANFTDVFELSNRCGKESIFEVLFITDLAGNNFAQAYAPRGAPNVVGNGYGIFRVSQSLYSGYSDTDTRKATFLTSYVRPGTNEEVPLSIDDPDPAKAISFWKLADMSAQNSGGGGKSFPYMRFSEVLLIYAEALNEANGGPDTEAYVAINRVRERAGIPLLSGLSKSEFRDAVLQERRLELCFEGHRWFDLVRTGRLVNAVREENSFGRNALVQDYHTLFPIPQREMDANPALVQNNGY